MVKTNWIYILSCDFGAKLKHPKSQSLGITVMAQWITSIIVCNFSRSWGRWVWKYKQNSRKKCHMLSLWHKKMMIIDDHWWSLMIIDDHWWSTINFEACLFSKPCKFSDVQTALLKAQQNTIVPMDSARMLYFPKSKKKTWLSLY